MAQGIFKLTADGKKLVLPDLKPRPNQILTEAYVWFFNCSGLQEYNLKYVDLIEEQLNEALTTYRKPVDGDNYVRRSNQRWGKK